MATFITTGYKSPGTPFTVSYTTAPTDDDFLVINGVRLTLREWKRSGVLTITKIDTSGKTFTVYPYANPEIAGSAPNGSSVSTNS